VIVISSVATFTASLAHATDAGRWTAEEVKVVTGLSVPECVCPDPSQGNAYVSNIEAEKDAYWDNDGKGFISLIASDGSMQELRWLDSAPDAIMNSPKGMGLLGDYLYFSDNARLMRCSTKPPRQLEVVKIPPAQRLNDVGTDGRAVYLTDTALGLIYRVAPDGGVRRLAAPPSVNGVAFHKEHMYAVSWDAHDVFELDPEGKAEPKPFGVSEHFTNLDGIEVLDDGTFIVSDFIGNKVCAIAPDRKTVYTLAEVETPADMGLDRDRSLLYVPLFMKDQVVVYRLERAGN